MSQISIHETLLAAYAALLIPLAIFSLHRLFLALGAMRRNRVADDHGKELPEVLIQLPLYNERYVVQRLLNSVSKIRYPKDKLHIQVLDDSTDDTPEIVAEAIAALGDCGLRIDHVRRPQREGFKAGALAYGLRFSKASFVAIFDADFVPPADFLERLMAEFDDASVGMVQARWGHLNAKSSALTAAQAVLLDGHFLNEHAGRAARGCFFNFNGTAGIWRRQAIEDGGGWLARTITEDLDLSYRSQLAGWRFKFRPDVVVPAELPANAEAFKSQQHRWAKGAIETARYVLPAVWRHHGLPLRIRIEASFHLLGNLAYPLVIVLALLLPWVIQVRLSETVPWPLWVDGMLFVSATLSLMSFYLVAVLRSGFGARGLWAIPWAMAVGAGLAINNTRALVEALLGHRSAFVRTPKEGDCDREAALPKAQASSAKGYRQMFRGLGQGGLEIVFALYLAMGLWWAMMAQWWLVVPFVVLFAGGFGILGVGTLRLWYARQGGLATFGSLVWGRLRMPVARLRRRPHRG